MTRLLLIRHGIAEPYLCPDSDSERALSVEGLEGTRRAMAGLVSRGFLPNRGISSPFRRALESMACLKEAAANEFPVGVWEGLTPDSDVLLGEAWLRRLMLGAGRDEVLAFTSHQPFLGDLIHHLTGRQVHVRTACCTVIDWTEGVWSLVAHYSPEDLQQELH